MKTCILTLLSLLCVTTSFTIHQDRLVKIALDEHKSGHYFIVSTSDRNKGLKYKRHLKFDANNVIYLDSCLFNNCRVIPVDFSGKDLSKRMKSFMGNEFLMYFYNPTDDEYKDHPEWSDYYHKYHASTDMDRLEKLGYLFNDSTLIKKADR